MEPHIMFAAHPTNCFDRINRAAPRCAHRRRAKTWQKTIGDVLLHCCGKGRYVHPKVSISWNQAKIAPTYAANPSSFER
jgi:hypothetical protein